MADYLPSEFPQTIRDRHFPYGFVPATPLEFWPVIVTPSLRFQGFPARPNPGDRHSLPTTSRLRHKWLQSRRRAGPIAMSPVRSFDWMRFTLVISALPLA